MAPLLDPLPALWHISLFGKLHLRGARGELSRFRTRKTGLLLAYLAHHCHYRLTLDPYYERATQALIRAYFALQRPYLAQEKYNALSMRLAELSCRPSGETERLFGQRFESPLCTETRTIL